MGGVVALVIRLLVPLTLFRWPLAGGIACIVADTSDIVFFNIFGFPDWDYQHFDKLLDLYYLAFEVALAQRWERCDRMLATGLFGWRLIGAVLFEVTGVRWILIIFPNLFEWYWLFVVAVRKYYPHYQLTVRRTLGWLVVLLIPKLAQEYALHVARWLDQWLLSDLFADLWR